MEPEAKKSAGRLDYIDLLEFIAMLLILMYHCTTFDYNFIESPSAVTYFNYLFRGVLSAGVPLFFFANGYLLFNREFVLKKHIIKIFKLIVLTVLWGFINVLLMMPIDQNYLSVKEILVTVWTWKQGWINQFWFMGTLICIYILFPVLKSAFDSNKNAFIFFVAACAIMTFGNKLLCGAGTVAAHSLINYPEQIKTNVFNIFNPFQGIYWYSFVYFCCGGLAHLLLPYMKEKKKTFNRLSVLAVLISTALLMLWGVYLSKLDSAVWDHVWGGYDTVFTFVNVAAIFVLCLNYKPKESAVKKAVETVSRNTLGIYFIHEIFIHLTLQPVKEVSAVCNIFGCLIYSLVLMLVCVISALIIKKIPIIKRTLL